MIKINPEFRSYENVKPKEIPEEIKTLSDHIWLLRQELLEGKGKDQAVSLGEHFAGPFRETLHLVIVYSKNKIELLDRAGWRTQAEILDEYLLMLSSLSEALTLFGERDVVPDDIRKKADTLIVSLASVQP